MLSIALVTPHLGRDGGVSTHVVDSARALAAGGHSVVLVGGEASDRLDWGGERVVEGGLLEERLGRSETARVLATVADLSSDVVHVHNLSDSRLAARLREVAPLVFSAHGYAGCSPNTHYFKPGEECERAHGPGCVPHMLLRGCLHSKDPRPIPRYYRATSARVRTMMGADAVVAYSTRILRHLARNHVPDARLVPLFVPQPATVPAPGAQERRVLFVGRVVEAKGLDVLIRAMPRVDAELEVCGDGWFVPRARDLAERLGIAARIRFSGWQSPAGLEEAYARAAVVALPSVWPEPFGLVGLEALARGRPVVASDTGGIRDWLSDGDGGLLVAPGDADALAECLNRVLDDPRGALGMARSGAERVRERFTAERHRLALEDVYADAIAGWRAGRPLSAGRADGDTGEAPAADASP
jgi:glycosyltransferase involved in cell wall biosynthesis